MTGHFVVCFVVFTSARVERPKHFDADALSYLILYIIYAYKAKLKKKDDLAKYTIQKMSCFSSGSKGLLWFRMWQRQRLYESRVDLFLKTK